MTKTLNDRIKRMNDVFDLPSNDFYVDQGNTRIDQFHTVLRDEIDELLEVKEEVMDEGERFVKMADCLADIIVYARSEARRWGIPIDTVLSIVMDSQDSKLVDGKAVMSEDGSKFIKGPNYEPPEEKIRALVYDA